MIEAQRVPPSACRTSQSSQSVRSPSASKSQTARSARPIRRWISTVRPSGRPRDTARCVRSPVEAGSIEYSAVIQPRPLPVEPARHALLDRRRAEDERLPLPVEHGAVRLLEEVGLDSSGRSSSSACGRRALMRGRLERRDVDVLGYVDRELEEPPPHLPEELGVARGEEAVGALASGRVLDSLARERLRDLARGLLRREDERDPTAEDALEDRPDQRVVGATRGSPCRPRLLQRRRVLADGVGRVLAERVVALDQRDEARAGDRDDLDPGVERVRRARA